MNPDTKKSLINKRRIAKSKISIIKKYIDAITDDVPVDVHNITIRRDALQKAWDDYNEAQDELEINDDTQNHAADRETYSDVFYDLHAKMSRIIESKNKLGNESLASSHSVANSQTSANNLRLPTIKLPTFNNNILEFRHFHDTFHSLVVQNSALDDIQKYYYLLSSLTGEAHKLIENLPVTSENFSIAWNLICDRYNNPRLVATTHVKALLNPPVVTRECPQLLRELLNHCKSNVNAIEALGLDAPLHELIISQLYLEKVDDNTRKDWELRHSSQETTSLNDFLNFLEQRCQALDLFKSSMPIVSSQGDKVKPIRNNRDTRHSYVSSNHTCVVCKKVHFLYKCSKFREATLQQRLDVVRENNLCFNCLSSGHSSSTCPSEHKCRQCGRAHHTLIHRHEAEARPTSRQPFSSQQQQGSSSQGDKVAAYCAFKHKPSVQILLATAQVLVHDSIGNLHKCRALLDSASQTNFVTESLVQRLHLKKDKNQIPIQGINEVTSKTNHSVNLQLQSTSSDFKVGITCSVLPSITGALPSTPVQFEEWNIPDDIQLADCDFHKPGRVDLLLGAELFFDLLRPERRTKPGNYPVLQNTELGWILSGKIPASRFGTSLPEPQRSFFLRNNTSLDQQLQRFWELEDLPHKSRTSSEELCEKHFRENTIRDSTGRYIVRLPRRPDHMKLGESYSLAKQRLVQLERRLLKQPDVREAYNEFMCEYEELGHMKEVDVGSTPEGRETFYLPHHAVFKASSTTTSTRVVFDGSARSSNGLSLNDTLLVGTIIQQDLYSIVLRFRTRPIAFSADISKMYRQIQVDPSDTPLQRILWRSTPDEPIKIFELSTVTYGTSCAPFLATRTLHQLAIDEKDQYRKASEILRRDFYVDDLITATGTIVEALQLQKDIIALLQRGGFHLRKFSANHQALLDAVPIESRETQSPISLDNGDSVKTLGLLWNPSADQFLIRSASYHMTSEGCVNLTSSKREIASVVASIFDPLGLISPIVIMYKMFLQQLWISGLGWDDMLPEELQLKWSDLHMFLSHVNCIRIERSVIKCDNPVNIQIHGFSDASEKGYGACLYLRSTDDNGNVESKLLCSKSRVAPVKRITIPRLELCGAVLLSKLIEKTVPILELKIDSIHLYTDSTIVLAWIRALPTRWKTFVANRVSYIQERTCVSSWRHVSTQDNPADFISRGVDPITLQQSELWWQGPEWLRRKEEVWKKTADEEYPVDVPEQRPLTSLLTTRPNSDDIITQYSSYTKLIRVMAYCKRFIHNCRSARARFSGPLSALELNEASLTCIRIVQQTSYPQEVKALLENRALHKKSPMLTLNPFMDDAGLLRVGGRLLHSDLPYETKHQLILPPSHHFTRLLIAYEHIRLLHGGSQLVLSSLRTKYWVPRARQAIRSVLHKCLPCFKLKANTSHQLMGQLPKNRVQATRPFLTTGVDFAGPVHMKTGSVRSKTHQKCYIAIFVCFSTRAVHIELVTSLKAEAFIAALRRFVARRGHIQDLYSDNGTSFIGASKELSELRRQLKNQQFVRDLKEYAATAGLTWHFIPPQSPHFGGLWESSVKSMKHHFRRVMGKTLLTYEELSTLLSQIEACLNSRPLCALSDDSNDPSILTPGHFLIGGPLMSIPDPDVTELALNRLSRWQHLQQMQQHWWSRWSKDYLHTLQQRKKWASSSPNLQPGTLVLLKDDHLQPLEWKIGVVDQVFPGKDDLVRVATVRCGSTTLKRAIHKLVPLPPP